MNAHDPTNTESDPYPHTDIDRHLQSHARFARAASSPEVIAAAQFLLQQPDAYLYRRRYLELIVQTTDSDGTPITDYTAAEKYLLTAYRKILRSDTGHPSQKESRTVDSSKDISGS
ncbi:hypothetical protein [Rhodococcus sp. YH3-3]|uniref:hypothetical protein n=1 Tax=Rhodococcus sp. YH3-3 TaxID=1803579 RepID=UPI000B1195E0|nr:hypothetical protein [Rhodococcus sp. YH3-3]